MYIAGLVIPVPEEKMEAYRKWAENGAQFFKEYGCLEIVECWEDNVPDCKQTDFRRAVAAKAGEKIVFTWQVWPDKASFRVMPGFSATGTWGNAPAPGLTRTAEAKMHQDKRMDTRRPAAGLMADGKHRPVSPGPVERHRLSAKRLPSCNGWEHLHQNDRQRRCDDSRPQQRAASLSQYCRE
jgi:uncharacterized protein YbaA (DUF1428 family)